LIFPENICRYLTKRLPYAPPEYRQAKQTHHPACRANTPAIGAPDIAVRRNKHTIPPAGRTARRLALLTSPRQAKQTLPHACRANSPAIGAPNIAVRRKKRYLTPAGRTARRLALPTSPSGETNTSSRLPGEQPGDWRHNHRRQAKQTLHPACRANSPAIGAIIIAVRRKKHYLTPAGRTARRLAQTKPPGIRSDIAQPGAFCKKEPTGAYWRT